MISRCSSLFRLPSFSGKKWLSEKKFSLFRQRSHTPVIDERQRSFLHDFSPVFLSFSLFDTECRILKIRNIVCSSKVPSLLTASMRFSFCFLAPQHRKRGKCRQRQPMKQNPGQPVCHKFLEKTTTEKADRISRLKRPLQRICHRKTADIGTYETPVLLRRHSRQRTRTAEKIRRQISPSSVTASIMRARRASGFCVA